MRPLFTILIVACMMTASCRKDNTSEFINDGKLTGTWELRHTGAAMTQPVAVPAGNGNLIQFSATEYAIYEQGQLKKKGSYTVVEDSTVTESVCLVIPTGLFTRRIVYDNDLNATKIFIDLSDGSLRFISGCYAYDAGHSEDYVKIANDTISD